MPKRSSETEEEELCTDASGLDSILKQLYGESGSGDYSWKVVIQYIGGALRKEKQNQCMAVTKPAYRIVGLQERKAGGKNRNAGCELLGADVEEEVRASPWMLTPVLLR